MLREANRQRMDEAKAAAKKAGWILHQCKS
jgi:hypothetical protein